MKPATTLSDLKKTACWKLNGHLDVKTIPLKKSKYRSVKTILDGITFDSLKEANRYIELRMLKTAGLITDIQLQKEYELNEGGSHSLKYFADFVYTDEKGNQVVEDCKGYRTAVYKKKRKLMKDIYNIEIKEV